MRTSTAVRVFRALAKALVVALVVAWFFVLRPQLLGGPADYVIVSGTSMHPGYTSGDVVVVRERDTYRTGDVVSYRIPAGEVGAGTRVIHRIVGGSASGYVVRGDNRTAVDPWRPTESDIVGSAWLYVPRAGLVILLLRSPFFLAALAAALVAVAVLARGSAAVQP
jgi:signal peptidase